MGEAEVGGERGRAQGYSRPTAKERKTGLSLEVGGGAENKGEGVDHCDEAV